MPLQPGFSMSTRQQLMVAGVISAAVLAVPLVFRSLLSSTFLPHAFCYSFDRRLISLHLVSDVLIWLSYVAIASTLVYLVRRARAEMPFHWMFLAFGVSLLPVASRILWK